MCPQRENSDVHRERFRAVGHFEGVADRQYPVPFAGSGLLGNLEKVGGVGFNLELGDLRGLAAADDRGGIGRAVRKRNPQILCPEIDPIAGQDIPGGRNNDATRVRRTAADAGSIDFYGSPLGDLNRLGKRPIRRDELILGDERRSARQASATMAERRLLRGFIFGRLKKGFIYLREGGAGLGINHKHGRFGQAADKRRLPRQIKSFRIIPLVVNDRGDQLIIVDADARLLQLDLGLEVVVGDAEPHEELFTLLVGRAQPITEAAAPFVGTVEGQYAE